MPETADVGDGGSVFAPASGAHKRPRIERIHQTVKKQNPPCKRICLGGGRVSGRSRDTLITGLISREDLVQQPPIVVTRVETESGAGQPHPSDAVRASTIEWVNLSIEQDLRRYSEIHAETEAASSQLRATLAAAGASGYQTDAETLGAHRGGLAPTTISQRDVAPTTIRERDGLEVDVAPTTNSQRDVAPTPIPPLTGAEVVVAHAAVAQNVSSRPIPSSSSTQTGSLMLRTYAFDDTRSGYYDDYDLDYPLI